MKEKCLTLVKLHKDKRNKRFDFLKNQQKIDKMKSVIYSSIILY